MARIKIISEEEAQSPLKELYQQIKSDTGIETVPNLLAASSIDHELMNLLWQSFKTIMLRNSKLPRHLKEMIGVIVSKTNSCQYCCNAHNFFLKAIGYDDKKVEELNEDYQSSSLSEKDKAILDLAVKITNNAWKITDEEMELLKEKFGITDVEILEIVNVASYFNYVNRLADALGVQFGAIQNQ